MIRTLEYSGIAYKNVRLGSADIYVYPDVLDFKRTDFHRAADIAQAGYDCARTMLVEHRDKFHATGSTRHAAPATADLEVMNAVRPATTMRAAPAVGRTQEPA
jgi:hypothetical protein